MSRCVIPSSHLLFSARWSVALALALICLIGRQSMLMATPIISESTLHSYHIDQSYALIAAQPTTQTITTTRGSGISLPGLSTVKPDQRGADEASEEENASGATQATRETTEQETIQPVDNLGDVRAAVVQIEAIGTFVDPAEGLQLNAAGRGSGFIIDPSGIAVTNNHVVTGGGLYKIYLDGEDEPRNAKVLGVSECADLAVIDIQGDGFAYLDWYADPIKVGLDVYAAGFPLGDPEYTLTRGIVAKERANGDTNWASVSKVIQHDATINPGNSGGPLVDKNGQVVAVNYAGNSQTNQYFAISRDDALAIIEQLRTGVNVDTIGINGEAVSDGENFSGIWVSSVKSGSPADRVGIQPGDVLMTMEGISLATDGTMATYCDILRSHQPDDVLAVQVLRFETQEMLEGQLNGRELSMSFSFAEQLDETNTDGDQSTTAGASAAYSGYTVISDRSGILAVEVPVEWADVADSDWIWQDETVGIRLVATTDMESVFKSWGTPGVIFNVSTTLAQENAPDDLLKAIDYSDACTYAGREAIPDGFYSGAYDVWTDCAGGDSRAVIVSVVPETQAYIVLFEIYIAGDADIEALDHILDSFVVDLANNATGSQGALSEEIFDQVDVSGLTYDFALVSQPALTAILPTAWADVANSDWVNDNEELLGKTLSVSPDIQQYNDTWTMAGLYVRSATGLEEELNIADLLNSVDLSDRCTYDQRYDHTHTILDKTYSGAYDLYTGCEGEQNAFAYLVVQSEDLDQAVFLEFLATTEADAEAFDVLLQSFYVDPAAADDTESVTDNNTIGKYTLITDETDTLTVRLPVAWADVSSGDWILNEEVIGVSLKAAENLDAYDNSWSAPGMFFGASTQFAGVDTAEILDALDYSDNCKNSDRFDYEDSVFSGHYDLWEGCGGAASLWVVLAAAPKESADYLVLINVLLPDSNDVEALEQIFKSFNVSYSDAMTGSTQPTAQVTTAALNVRSGPGTNYGRIGGVGQGDQLLVLGEYNNCSWLYVQTRDELLGWVSGSATISLTQHQLRRDSDRRGAGAAGQ